MSRARRLVKRAFRDRDDAFLVEGPQAVREAVADPRHLVRSLFATEEAAARHPEIVEAARLGGAECHLVSGAVLASLTQTVTPQGLVAVARRCATPWAEALAADPQLAVILAAVRDPGNAGTVVRTADAAGVEAVVLTDASVDLFNNKTVRATAGSLFHLPVSVGVPVAAAVDGLRAAGCRVLAADGSGAVDLDELAGSGGLAGPTAWLFGNEAWGLPAGVRDLADVVVRVPIHGRAESLNLATAAAVCLYASASAQRAPGGCRRRGDGFAPQRG